VKLSGQDAEKLFGFLQVRRDKIEQNLGTTLSWEERSRGGYTIGGCSMSADPSDPTDWPRQHQWLCDTLKRFSEMVESLLGEYGSSRDVPPSLDA
jgi:hypothetical protein